MAAMVALAVTGLGSTARAVSFIFFSIGKVDPDRKAALDRAQDRKYIGSQLQSFGGIRHDGKIAGYAQITNLPLTAFQDGVEPVRVPVKIQMEHRVRCANRRPANAGTVIKGPGSIRIGI